MASKDSSKEMGFYNTFFDIFWIHTCMCRWSYEIGHKLHKDKISSKTNAGIKPNHRFKRTSSPRYTVLHEGKHLTMALS